MNQIPQVRIQNGKLESIAPKRIKGPDGKEYVWHCPNEMIPLDGVGQDK